jgi:hypothetical protein
MKNNPIISTETESTIGSIDNYILVEIFRFLTWYDFVQIQLTCKRFGVLIKDRENSSIWHTSYLSLTFSRFPFSRCINWHEKVAETAILTSGRPLTVRTLGIEARRSGHSLSILNDKYAVIFGGMCMLNTFNPSFFVGDLTIPQHVPHTAQTKRIAVTGTVPSKRWLHSSNTIKLDKYEFALIFGGFSDDPVGYCNDIHKARILSDESLVCERVEAIGDIPATRCGHSSVNISGRELLVFGGNSSDAYFNDLFYLLVKDDGTLKWTRLEPAGSPPSPRYCHSAVYGEGNMYIFGGWSDVEFYNNVFMYNVASNHWSELATSGAVPRPMCQCAAAYFPPSYCFTVPKSNLGSSTKGYMMIFGGAYRTELVRSYSRNIKLSFFPVILNRYFRASVG